MIIQIRKFNKVIPLIFDTQLFSSGLVLSAIVTICVAWGVHSALNRTDI